MFTKSSTWKVWYFFLFGVVVLGVLLFAQSAEASALRKAPNNLGLVGYWSLDDATGIIATDFSGSGIALFCGH